MHVFIFFTIIKFKAVYFWTSQGHCCPLIDKIRLQWKVHRRLVLCLSSIFFDKKYRVRQVIYLDKLHTACYTKVLNFISSTGTTQPFNLRVLFNKRKDKSVKKVHKYIKANITKVQILNDGVENCPWFSLWKLVSGTNWYSRAKQKSLKG